MQRTFTGLKIAGLLVLIVAGLFSSHTATPAAAPPLAGLHFGVAMVACLMAYNGWSYVNFVAGEVRDPQKNLLRSLVVGMVAVGLLYLSANVAYLKVMTVAQIAATDRVGADLATRTMGSIGGTFVSLTVLISIAGAVNGCILTGARIPFAQARDGLFFARFGEVHPRFQTPGFAVLCSGIWTAILVLTGSYETLYSYSILAAWIFYTMSVGAVFVLRRKLPDAAPAVPDVGLPIHAVAVRGDVRLGPGGLAGNADGAVADGVRHGGGRSGGVQVLETAKVPPSCPTIIEWDQIIEAERQHVRLVGRVDELLAFREVLAEHAGISCEAGALRQHFRTRIGKRFRQPVRETLIELELYVEVASAPRRLPVDVAGTGEELD